MKREYSPNKLGRSASARMTDEDYEILHRVDHGGFFFHYGRADRADAEIMFARVDSGPDKYPGCDQNDEKEKTPADRGSGCGDGPL